VSLPDGMFALGWSAQAPEGAGSLFYPCIHSSLAASRGGRTRLQQDSSCSSLRLCFSKRAQGPVRPGMQVGGAGEVMAVFPPN
jgi:hypothetical protein